MARVVAAGLPHHVTRRGNRRQQTFFSDENYETWESLLTEHCGAAIVKARAYCPTPKDLHTIRTPADPGCIRSKCWPNSG